jgi:HK97 family phage portal protein
MRWFFSKKEQRAAEPHIEVKNDACTEVITGTALMDRLLSLNGYGPYNQSAFFSAVNLISNSVAQMSWQLKAYDEQDEPDNTFLRNLLYEGDITQFLLIKNIVKDCITHGNGFCYIHRDNKGYPVSLEYLPHGTCTIVYNPATRVLFYQAPLISTSLIEPINIIHLRMMTDDGINGQSIVSYAKNVIKINGAAEKAASTYYTKGCRYTGVLTTDNPSLSEKSRKNILDSWLKSGEGMNGTAVLEAGMHYQPITSNSKDAQLLETRLFNVQEIARFFNMSPTLLGDLSKSSYNTLEASQQAFVLNALMPYVILLEQELNQKLLTVKQRQVMYIDIKEEDIIKSDKNSQANYLTTLCNSGLITRNEARKELGFGPIEGGDELIIAYTDISQNTIGGNNEEDKNTEEENDEEQ